MDGAEDVKDEASPQSDPEYARLRKEWRIYRPEELKQECARTGQNYLIEGLIPERSLGLIVGDSGLGKSPLAYQMAMSIAAGVPFLGLRTQQARVLYLDYENGLQDLNKLLARLASHLGLIAPPQELILFNINDCPDDWGRVGRNVLDLISDVKPGMVFIDPLSAVHQAIEKTNGEASLFYQMLRGAIRKFGCPIFNLHHRKKPMDPRSGRPVVTQSIEDEPSPRTWFAQARGPGVLVNGADVRLGVDIPGTSCAGESDIALVMRGYGRVRGEIPTIHLARVLDQEGEPLGYRKATGIDLLCNQDQQDTFGRLPDRFQFKEAKREYGKADQATIDFLNKCIAKGILHRVAKGVYEKVNLEE